MGMSDTIFTIVNKKFILCVYFPEVISKRILPEIFNNASVFKLAHKGSKT